MKRFKNILFVADPELRGGEAFERAVMLAENNQAQLTVVSILEELPTPGNENIQGISMQALQNAIMDKQQQQLENLLSSIGKTMPISAKVLTGVAFLVLIREVLSKKIDLLIKTADEEDIMDKFFGSSDMHLLRKCPCPVWLVKASREGHYKKIMAAVDFDPFDNNREENALNRKILQISTALALADFSELHIIHVWHAYGESSMRSGLAYQPAAYVDAYVDRVRVNHQHCLDALLADVVDKSGKETANYLKPRIHLMKGFAKDMIPKIVKQQEIDLLVMGTVGRTGIPGFLIGNTAETVLNRIDCSVLAIKPEGFITPVRLEE
ncbi:MAG: universal stress protein [gamma proteobacterium symbiont of Bathyaustriella thionipta]|nr:universal stress protein [gamma proteobacterium symbiont of Bathyaustriella thionipta]MCU7948838.1 universal stress protein [gamma proteobacterium symbiont of Bathyaustriella thionipta]MCU7954351.1 universal stress protein [gamma proteobacterium symbiont of Bathyaustriella thionipta]MCU7955296.1 universal stress protein [gamma proteobacterium symbiont of Bathyaustriella thionipta]MCU7967125.1 universal stress protein [gamma proteobacterium symbiont of Bathyaustriella thionipta]